MRVVVALGGNAILPKGSPGTADDQRAAIDGACTQLVALMAAGHDLVLTHGNGPQVGRLLLQQRAGEREVPPLPLDVLGAQTQGQIGYLLQQRLGVALAGAGLPRPVVSLVSQTVVDADHPAMSDPDKPVGPHYTETELEHRLGRPPGSLGDGLTADGATYRRVAGGTWRRVVASPPPIDVLEAPAVRALLDSGAVPVCAGGGGAPVRRAGGDLVGVEAVVDKDATAALLAGLLEADALLILTDVDRVAVGFGTSQVRWLDRLAVDEARRLVAVGEFPAGSMGPKVTAAADAAERGAAVVITSLERAADALAGDAGTAVVAGDAAPSRG